MAELAVLRAGDVPVAVYDDGVGLERVLAPRPHLHPVHTLTGRVVTDAVPADHRWHLGLSVALQDVGGHNLWGGRTYLPGRGYTWREDHGRIEHAGFDRAADDGLDEGLRWLGADGTVLLTERRRVRVRAVEAGWELALTTTLANATGAPLRLGSPATNGRTGAGYGGLFWRLPPAVDARVHTADGEGEEQVHGSVAPWLAWSERGPEPFTLVLVGTGPPDPWFVRMAGYPGIGCQLAAVDPVELPPGGAVTRGLRALVADGVLPDADVAGWARSAGTWSPVSYAP